MTEVWALEAQSPHGSWELLGISASKDAAVDAVVEERCRAIFYCPDFASPEIRWPGIRPLRVRRLEAQGS